jgi:hypothetical protein
MSPVTYSANLLFIADYLAQHEPDLRGDLLAAIDAWHETDRRACRVVPGRSIAQWRLERAARLDALGDALTS